LTENTPVLITTVSRLYVTARNCCLFRKTRYLREMCG